MKVKEIVKEMVETRSIHALDIRVLIAPGKGLLTDDGVNRVKFRNIGIIHILTVLKIGPFHPYIKSMYNINLILVVQEMKAINGKMP